jgi:hypothetical protein
MGWKGLVGVRVSRRFGLEAGFTDFGAGVGTATLNARPHHGAGR